MRSLRALLVTMLCASLFGCGSVAPPPPSSPSGAGPGKGTGALPAVPGLSLIGAAPGLPGAPAALAEPLPGLGRGFVEVGLPAGAPEVLAVAGRDPKDVWLLGSDAATPKDVWVMRWDGAAIKRVAGPKCSRAPYFLRLMVSPSEVLVQGTYYTNTDGEHVGWVESRWGGKGDWSCKDGNLILPGDIQTTFAGGAEIRFESDRQFVDRGPSVLVDGRARATPPLDGLGWVPASGPVSYSAQAMGTEILQTQLVARTPGDLWLYNRTSGLVLRSGGGAWEARPTGLSRVVDLWVDDTGSAWALGSAVVNDKDKPDGQVDVVLRWSVEHGEWTRLAVPASLRVSRVSGTSARDVWLFGAKAVYRWDGEKLRGGDSPVSQVRGVWGHPSGELWVVGSGAPKAPGKVFRLASVEGKAP